MFSYSLSVGGEDMKRPNVSGQFYPSNAKDLSFLIDRFFSQADIVPVNNYVDVLIVPHAGYIYSGGVAAYGFKAVSKNNYKTIVILAASHHFPFEGISIWPDGGFEMPLGVVPVDSDFARSLAQKNNHFIHDKKVFDREHSLEVEIPFLQKTFQDFKIVPVIFGQPPLKTIADFSIALREVVADREDVLVVVSTDMSHFYEDKKAREKDRMALDAIKAYDVEAFWKGCQVNAIEMCGFMPVTAALLYAKQKGLDKIDVLRYANSADVSGDKSRVVGYSSIIIYSSAADKMPLENREEKKDIEEGVLSLNLKQKKRLLSIARDTIDTYIRRGKKLEVQETDPRLLEEEGAFVTIHKKGDLRGCIGNIIGRGPLYQTVRDMAIASATQDPRFSPVEEKELENIDIEISVLSKPRVIKSADEIILGKHGVIISKGFYNSGVFLPQVATETGWSKEEFLSQLCYQKAGLAPNCWKDPSVKMQVFSAQVFSEKE